MQVVHGDAGGTIIVAVFEKDDDDNTLPVDLTETRLVRFDVTRGDNSTEQWVGSVYGNNKIVYTIPPNTLTEVETILLRPYVEWSDDVHFHSLASIILSVLP